MNVAIDNHSLIGTEAVYRSGETAMPRSVLEKDPSIILAPGFPVTVEMVFANWNCVDGNDMLYVYIPWSDDRTHVTPADLGLNSVASYM